MTRETVFVETPAFLATSAMVICLSIKIKSRLINLINKFNIEYQNIYDEKGELVKDFNVLGFPTTLFFDENHKLSKKWTGYLDEENLIEQLEKINK